MQWTINIWTSVDLILFTTLECVSPVDLNRKRSILRTRQRSSTLLYTVGFLNCVPRIIALECPSLPVCVTLTSSPTGKLGASSSPRVVKQNACGVLKRALESFARNAVTRCDDYRPSGPHLLQRPFNPCVSSTF